MSVCVVVSLSHPLRPHPAGWPCAAAVPSKASLKKLGKQFIVFGYGGCADHGDDIDGEVDGRRCLADSLGAWVTAM